LGNGKKTLTPERKAIGHTLARFKRAGMGPNNILESKIVSKQCAPCWIALVWGASRPYNTIHHIAPFYHITTFHHIPTITPPHRTTFQASG
jgi:hypothetical protein